MRILTFNCHEAYLHNLSRAVDAMDVIIDLPGHHVGAWDARMRPVPANATLVGMRDLDSAIARSDCLVVHNLTELLTLKRVERPKVLVLHSSLKGRIEQEASDLAPEDVSRLVAQYAAMTGLHLVAISEMKRATWDLEARIIRGAVDVTDYGPYEGDLSAGLRVANHVTQKTRYLRWDLHEQAFEGLPIRLVGANPDRPGVSPARGWDELRALYRRHRFFIHTAAVDLEDGYNLASLEAMATGMPVVCSDHPTSPIDHGVNGLVGQDAQTLRAAAERLLAAPDLARRLGAAARQTVLGRFGIERFVADWRETLAEAVQSHAARRGATRSR